jgi:hypothetical protein
LFTTVRAFLTNIIIQEKSQNAYKVFHIMTSAHICVISCYDIRYMHNEKMIKKLLSKCESDILIGKFFDIHTKIQLSIKDNDGISDKSDFFINHFNSLLDEERLEVMETLSNLLKLLSEDGYNITSNLRSKIDNEYDILAEKSGDKVLAFYVNNSDKLQEAYTLAEFYKISGYARYEGGGNSLENFEDFISNLSESLTTKLLDAGSAAQHTLQVYKFEDMIFVKVSYSDKATTYFIYNPVSKDVLIKNTFKNLKAFDLAALTLLKFNNYVMEEKFIEYEMSKFEIVKVDQPFGVGNKLSDWYIKSIKFKSGEDDISFNFKIEEESKYMSKYLNLTESLGLNKRGGQIMQVALLIKLVNSKRKHSINIKSNKSNINILKKDHQKIEEILKSTGIHKGWKVKEV